MRDIGIVIFLIFLVFIFDPGALGTSAGEVVKAFRAALGGWQ